MNLGDRWTVEEDGYTSHFEARLCPGPAHEPNSCDTVTAVQVQKASSAPYRRCEPCGRRHRNRRKRERSKAAKQRDLGFVPIPVHHPRNPPKGTLVLVPVETIAELRVERSYRKGFGYGSFREFHPTKH